MGRVRTKVRTGSSKEQLPHTFLSNRTDIGSQIPDREKVRQSHHRTLLPQAHPRLRNQQENM